VPIKKPTLRQLRKLMVAIGAETDAVTRQLTTAWVRAWDELATAYRQGITDAVDYAIHNGRWPNASELARLERLQHAVMEAERALAQLGERAGVTIRDGAGQVVAIDADHEPRLIASQLPAAEQAAAAARFAANIAPTALDMIVARSQGQIESALRPLSRDAGEAMRRELIRGVAVGSNPRDVVAKRMVDRVQGAFEGGLTRAMVIARTEMLDAYRAASRHSHAANADVVAGWTWMSTLDSRACPSCWSMHGKIFPVEAPGPLDHQQGRCARLPKTRTWRELGFDIDEPADDIPNAQTKFWTLPPADRKQIMGPQRLELLRSGRVGWDDLPTVRPSLAWRPSYAPRTVSDLERVAQQRAAAGIRPVVPAGAPKAPPAVPAKRGPLVGVDALDSAPWALGDRTGDIADAVRKYRASDYVPINVALRHQAMTPEIQRTVDLIDTAMNKSALPNDIITWRGGDGSIVPELRLADDLTGAEWTDLGYLSTTVTEANAQKYGGTILRIVAPRGTKALKLSDLGGRKEGELMLERGLRLRVAKDYGSTDGVRRLDVKVVQTGRQKATRPKQPAEPTLPATVPKWHRNLDGGLDDIARTVATPQAGSRPLGTGMLGDVRLVTYENGQVLVRKRYGARAEGVRTGGLKAQTDAEQLAPLVIRAVGSRAPAVLRTGAHELHMTHVDGKLGDELVPWGQSVPPHIVNSDDGRLIGLADSLMAHNDRNPGNWVRATDGRLWGIDHGFAFEPGISTPLLRGNEFATHFLGDTRGWAKTNDMSPADMAVIRTRLEALRPDFEHIGRLGWWQAMMKRMDRLSSAASGTRSRLT
jgi:SPP1 gp7 family putative phage head morphogenesis protein